MSILAGAVYGDHISPISDTTILSSTGAGCNHIDHISTQMIYATLAAVCCVIGYIVLGLTGNVWISLIISAAILVIAMAFFNRKRMKTMDIDYSKLHE